MITFCQFSDEHSRKIESYIKSWVGPHIGFTWWGLIAWFITREPSKVCWKFSCWHSWLGTINVWDSISPSSSSRIKKILYFGTSFFWCWTRRLFRFDGSGSHSLQQTKHSVNVSHFAMHRSFSLAWICVSLESVKEGENLNLRTLHAQSLKMRLAARLYNTRFRSQE